MGEKLDNSSNSDKQENVFTKLNNKTTPHNHFPTHQGLLTLTAISLILTVVVILLKFPKTRQINTNSNRMTSEQIEETVQSPVDTSNWKTYTNTDFEFQISYPEMLGIRKYTQDDNSYLFFKIGQNCIEITIYTPSSLNNLQNPDAYIHDYLINKELVIGETNHTNVDYKRLDNKMIGSAEWFQLEAISPYESHGTLPEYFLEREGYIWSIHSTSDAGCSSNQVNQILSTFQFLPDTSKWKTYTNKQFGFESEYYYDSPPTENIGTEDVGQFTYLFQVKFGANPLKSIYGYSVEISKKSLEDYKLELVGHITDGVDSVEDIKMNDISWSKINYQIFLTTDYVPITSAFTNNNGYSYIITAGSLDINQILSTFKFIRGEPEELSLWPPVCEKNDHPDFDINVEYGDGKTQIARKAVDNYVLLVTLSNIPSKEVIALNPEEKVYAEDTIVKSNKIDDIIVGSTIPIPCTIVEEAVTKARLLTISQKESLENYSDQVQEFGFDEWLRQVVEESSQDLEFKPGIIKL